MELSSTGFFLQKRNHKIKVLVEEYRKFGRIKKGIKMNKKVTKIDLVNEIYNKTEVSKKDVAIVVDAFLSELKESLVNESNIELRGFGTFELSYRKESDSARNPKTGEKVKVESHYVAKFRPGKELKESLMKIKHNDE